MSQPDQKMLNDLPQSSLIATQTERIHILVRETRLSLLEMSVSRLDRCAKLTKLLAKLTPSKTPLPAKSTIVKKPTETRLSREIVTRWILLSKSSLQLAWLLRMEPADIWIQSNDPPSDPPTS